MPARNPPVAFRAIFEEWGLGNVGPTPPTALEALYGGSRGIGAEGERSLSTDF